MEIPRAHTPPKGPLPIAGRRGERRWARSPGESWYRPALIGSDHHLLAASRALGARVFDAAGRRIGRVAELALDETSGAVAFVTLAGGGFLGFRRKASRIAWERLTYVPRRAGFVLGLDERRRPPPGPLEACNAP